MKKIILISFCFVIILIVCIFKDNKIDVVNKYYKCGNKTLYYPLFNIDKIDNYIKNYLNNNINYSDNLFLDYDYIDNKNSINITFYFYGKNSTGVRHKEESLYVDKTIEEVKKIESKTINTTSRKVNVKQNKYIAFTFDDGPNYNTSKMIDTLSKWNASATFFIVGNRIEKEEEIILKMKEKGMEIGNHTYSHKLLTKLNSSSIKEEISKTDRIIFDITGSEVKLVRPSYGSSNKKIRNIINRPIILWDIDTLDWKYHNSKRLSNYILKNVKDGDIVLMHDIYSATVNGVDMALPKLMEEGFKVVSVSELFAIKGKNMDDGMIYRKAS